MGNYRIDCASYGVENRLSAFSQIHIKNPHDRQDMTYDQILDNIRSNQNISLSRWGDGEFICMLQLRRGKCNTDGNYYYKDLGKELFKILEKRPTYFLGIQRLAKELLPSEVDTLTNWPGKWIDADVFHSASLSGRLNELHQALKKRSVILVGPVHLEHAVENASFVPTPDRNCWLDRSDILLKVKSRLKKRSDVVVLFCAGMAANYFVDALHEKYGDTHTFIDIGAVFDPYCGRNSRKYHSQIIDRLNGNKGSN